MPLFGEGEFLVCKKKFLFIGRVSSRNSAKAGAERNDKFDYTIQYTFEQFFHLFNFAV
jgi:hypothetical protein